MFRQLKRQISFTKLGYLFCPRKYFFNYILKWRTESGEEPFPLRFGNLGHLCLADSTAFKVDDLTSRVVYTLVKNYREFSGNESVIKEQMTRKEYETFILVGKIDQFNPRTKLITEFKFTSDFGAYNLMRLEAQVAAYLLLKPSAKKVRITLIRRPRLRLGGSETESHFVERLDKDIKGDPEKYFEQATYHKGLEIDTVTWFDYYRTMSEFSGLLEARGIYPANRGKQCDNCTFKSICMVRDYDTVPEGFTCGKTNRNI